MQISKSGILIELHTVQIKQYFEADRKRGPIFLRRIIPRKSVVIPTMVEYLLVCADINQFLAGPELQGSNGADRHWNTRRSRALDLDVHDVSFIIENENLF
jgi:hypothetical protein